MASVIDVTLALIDIEREGTRAQRVAAYADDLLRISMIQQVEGGVNAKTSAPTQNRISLSRHCRIPSFPGLFDDCPIIVARVARFPKKFDPSLRVVVKFRR